MRSSVDRGPEDDDRTWWALGGGSKTDPIERRKEKRGKGDGVKRRKTWHTKNPLREFQRAKRKEREEAAVRRGLNPNSSKNIPLSFSPPGTPTVRNTKVCTYVLYATAYVFV
jgi:hypothetical protein